MAVRAAPTPARRPGLSYRRLVVPLTAQVESETAMALAAELATDYGSAITAVLVIEVPPNLPLDCHMLDEEREARPVLEEARAIAERRGVRVHTRLVRAREAGEAIVDVAREAEADVVVLRAPRAGERRRKVFGKTVDYVLKHAPCRVLVAAPAAP
jgi:nucleotide-binding universal stress UspA family protein